VVLFVNRVTHSLIEDNERGFEIAVLVGTGILPVPTAARNPASNYETECLAPGESTSWPFIRTILPSGCTRLKACWTGSFRFRNN